MIDPKLRDEIAELCEESVLLDNPSFDGSIIGLTSDGATVYDLESMILEMAVENQISSDEAAEFIDYNTLRAIPYAPEPKPVVIAYKFKED